MIGAFIGADASRRREHIMAFLDRAEPEQIIYVCPRNLMGRGESLPRGTQATCFEDMEKRDEWLSLNAMVGPGTALIVECVARYPKITSTKFAHLQRLSQQVGHKFWADVVPFTLGIEYIYTPYSYLDRAILGFPHWYAFREKFNEIDESGKVVSSHDPSLIARKVSTVTEWGRPTLMRKRVLKHIASSPDEAERYEKKRRDVFESFASPSKAITALADLTHAFKSRRAFAVEIANSLDRPLVLTNLASYAAKLAPLLSRGAALSYALAAERRDLSDFSDVVYAECPIVKSYLAFDVEAQLAPEAKAHIIASDMKVDTFLRGQFLAEIEQINAVTKAALETHHAT